LTLASCNSETPSSLPSATTIAPKISGTPTTGTAVFEVDIKNLSFGGSISIPAGSTVIWGNLDNVDHTVIAKNGYFDSGTLAPGDSFQQVFTQEGAIDYYCRIHPFMLGKVTITPNPTK